MISLSDTHGSCRATAYTVNWSAESLDTVFLYFSTVVDKDKYVAFSKSRAFLRL